MKAVEEQIDAFKTGDIKTVRNGGYYTINDLNIDLDLKDNINIPLENIIDAKSEVKRWAPELKLIFKEKGKHVKSLNFAMVRGWIKYPLSDPIEYEKNADWTPFIEMINRYKG